MLTFAECVTRLDETTGLDVDVYLTASGRYLHGEGYCHARGTDFPETVNGSLLDYASQVCPHCWISVGEGFETESIVDIMYTTGLLEESIRQETTQRGDLLRIAGDLDTLSYPVEGPVQNWREDLRRQAHQRVDLLTTVVCTPEWREVSERFAGSIQPWTKWRDAALGSSDPQEVATRFGRPGALTSVPALAVIAAEEDHEAYGRDLLVAPHHLATRNGRRLLYAAEGVIDAVNSYDLFTVTQVARGGISADVLPTIVDLWNPSDPVFGDLERLTEAATLVH